MRKKLLLLTLILIIYAVFTQAQSISTGSGWHTICVKAGGTVYSWGLNSYGQLGNGSSGDNSSVPVAVTASGSLNGKTITMVATGSEHSMALASDGTVFTWGNNYEYQLGGNDGWDSDVPYAVTITGKVITKIASGDYHCLALASDGTISAWGANLSGQLGRGGISLKELLPVQIASGAFGGKTITMIAAGSDFSIALASDGTLFSWGDNSQGQLGTGNNTNSNVPVAVSIPGKTITKIAAGSLHCIALASEGTVYTWGYNGLGQLGNGNNTNSNVPVTVTTSGVLNGKTIVQVAAGSRHCIALDSDGKVYTWGYNIHGQLGNGNNTDSNVPVAVNASGCLSGKTITHIGSGSFHSIALASDESVHTWGMNDQGQLGNGSGAYSINVPVGVNSPLPVEMTLFKATVDGSNVELIWQTATETKNYGFDVEIRAKAETSAWQNIGFVPGNGNSNAPKSYSYTLKDVTAGLHHFRLKQIDTDGSYEYSDVIEVLVGAPMEFSLSQNYPNPFNPSTSISFDVPLKSNVTLTVFNALGEIVQTLAMGTYEAGRHQVTFNAASLPSGVYFYRLQAGDFVQTQKMLLLR